MDREACNIGCSIGNMVFGNQAGTLIIGFTYNLLDRNFAGAQIWRLVLIS